MQNRYISDPLDDLLQRSGLSPAKIDNAIEQLALRWAPTILRPGHDYLRQINDHTNINVVAISRKYRRLFVEIEQYKGGKAIWHYHERSRTACVFACLGIIPHTVESALVGRPLRSLIIPTPAIAATVVENTSREREGWMTLSVTPQWQQF